MYKICKTIESATRQREFESCLLNTMKTIPYESISVTDLCAQVGIARKNFYRYFGNKDDVLCALIDHTLLDYSQFETPYTSESPDGIKEILQYLSYWQVHKPLLDALGKNGLSTKLIERVLIHAWREDTGFLQLLHAKGNISDPSNVLFAVSGIITLIVTWHHSGYQESKEQLATTIYQLLTCPIVTI
ncbi:MAG: TetR/AcrR family transcriptional regulator [Agathobacter sp.]|nr:TetR/AcrR family transcriptional regulator [Agathobacter sp.]